MKPIVKPDKCNFTQEQIQEIITQLNPTRQLFSNPAERLRVKEWKLRWSFQIFATDSLALAEPLSEWVMNTPPDDGGPNDQAVAREIASAADALLNRIKDIAAERNENNSLSQRLQSETFVLFKINAKRYRQNLCETINYPIKPPATTARPTR
jgi:hypothetical protein